jgi:hypothetical protein
MGDIQGDSRVIMSPTELKVQPAIHLERKTRYGRGKYPALPSKCIVGCIFNSVGLIITRELPCNYKKINALNIEFIINGN